jgi:hypothetical protein
MSIRKNIKYGGRLWASVDVCKQIFVLPVTSGLGRQSYHGKDLLSAWAFILRKEMSK